MKNYNTEKSGKKIFTEVISARTGTAAFLFVLSLLLLLHARGLRADSGSGMISRAPLVKTIPKPTALEKISTDLGEIIKSINEIPDEVEDKGITAEPEAPVEKINTPATVIAKPEKSSPAPVKIKTVGKETITIPDKPVIAKSEDAAPIKPQTTQISQPAAIVSSRNAYSKFKANGEKLQDDTSTWACVVDEYNGLMWEVKSSNDDIRDKNHLYTWFDPSQEGIHGVADGGLCKGDIPCDTNAYIQAMNKQKLCGHDDWRLPTREEMLSLVYFGNNKVDARINIEYFPEAMASWYWTASSNENHPDYAWYVLFRNGAVLNDLKEHPKHIRLVRADKQA